MTRFLTVAKAWWRWHFYNASIQRLPGLSIAKVLRICQKGEIRVGFNPCAKVLPMLCQASITSRLSKGYLDHDICRWKTGKQFNATGMCTVHSAAYVHIQMLDVSLALLPSRIGSSWVSNILRRFFLFDSPISPKPKGLRHPNVAWFLKPPVKNVVGVLETGAVHGLIVSKKCHRVSPLFKMEVCLIATRDSKSSRVLKNSKWWFWGGNLTLLLVLRYCRKSLDYLHLR